MGREPRSWDGKTLYGKSTELGPVNTFGALAPPLRVRRKAGHTSLLPSALEPPKPFGQRLVWPDFRSQRKLPQSNSVNEP
jgi:hypothetical protein